MGTGVDALVWSGRHQYGESNLRGGSGGGGGRGQDGVVTEGAKGKTPGTEHQNRIQVVNLTN